MFMLHHINDRCVDRRNALALIDMSGVKAFDKASIAYARAGGQPSRGICVCRVVLQRHHRQ